MESQKVSLNTADAFEEADTLSIVEPRLVRVNCAIIRDRMNSYQAKIENGEEMATSDILQIVDWPIDENANNETFNQLVDKINSFITLSDHESLKYDMSEVCKCAENAVMTLQKSQYFSDESLKEAIFTSLQEIGSLAVYDAHLEMSRIVNEEVDAITERITPKRICDDILAAIDDMRKYLPVTHPVKEIINDIRWLVTADVSSAIFSDIADIVSMEIQSQEDIVVETKDFLEVTACSKFLRQFLIERSIFISCISGLIEECHNREFRDIYSSQYFSILIATLEHWFDTLTTFKNRVAKISKHFAKTYFRENWRNFLEELKNEACEILTHDNISAHRFFLCEKSKKWRGDILEMLLVSMKNLSNRMLAVEELNQNIFSDACKGIIRVLSTSNQSLRDTEYQSKHIDPITKFLEPRKHEKYIFPLIYNFSVNFKSDENLKRSELISFWRELSQTLLGENEAEECLYFFPDDYSDLISEIYAIANRYFKPLNQIIVDWNIVEEINKNLAVDLSESESATGENFDACVENFQTLIQQQTSVDHVEKFKKDERKTKKLIELLQKFSNLWSYSTCNSGVRYTLKLFYDNLRIRIQDFLTDGQTNASPVANFYQRMRDVSAHMVQYFLATEIYPQAEVCLAFIEVELALGRLQLWSSSTNETKWTVLQEVQDELKDALFPAETNDELNCAIKNRSSQIIKYQETGGDPDKIMEIWCKFYSGIKEFSNPSVNSDKKNGSCSKDDLTTTESFGNEKLEYLRKCFKLCCEDITMVKIDDKMFNEIQNMINQGNKNRIHRSNEHLGILEITERKRIDLSTLKPFLKVDFKIPRCFKDFASEFDKDDNLKWIDWVTFLETVLSLWNLIYCKNNEAQKIRRSSGSCDENEALMGNVRASKSCFILSYEIRPLLLDLEKEWYRRLKSVVIPLKSLLVNLLGLISQLEKAAPEKKVLEDIFEEEETNSENFNQIFGVLDIMNDNLDGKQSEKFRGMMKTVCTFESKYLSKYRLLNFWKNVEKVVKKFFRQQTSRDWKNMDTFRISVQEFNDLRKSIYDLAYKNLVQATCLDECSTARCDPINYILLSRCVRPISMQQKRSLAVLCAVIVIVVPIAIAVITVGWSNVKNFIEWIEDSYNQKPSNSSATSI